MLYRLPFTTHLSKSSKLLRVFRLAVSYLLLLRYVALSKCNFTSTYSPYGVKLHSNWGDSTFRYYCTCAYGHFFSEYLRSQKRDFIFLDVGANQGLYSILSALNDNCRHVYAFEPMNATAFFLEKNLNLNDVDHKVSVIQKAISLTTGKQFLHVFENQSGRASLKPHDSHRNVVEVDVIGSDELNEIIKDRKTRIILKIDVEGLEYEVLSAIFASVVSKQVDAIWFEIDENWSDRKAILELVNQNGFTNLKKVGAGLHYDILASKG